MKLDPEKLILQYVISAFQLVIIIFLALLLFSCKSKQKTVDKKAEKVSEIVKKDIKKTTETQLDVSVLEIEEKTEIRISPEQPKKPITVVFPNRDTLKISNGKISIGHEKTTKKTTDQSETQTHEKDKTKTKRDTETKEKIKQKDVKGSFPWWILIVVAVAFLIWKFAKIKPL